ncbi:hypothetical protein I4U23_022363 [Adineta vaga]|nr:hypothetical protein I4U23_022363 [Adineta vaga]
MSFLISSCLAIVANISTTAVSSLTTIVSNSNITCSMTTWSLNATTIAGSPIGYYGSIPTALKSPNDIYVDINNTLYVLDSGNYRVQRFLPNSTIGKTIINGSYGSMLNQFGDMQAIHVDYMSNIYIADSSNHRVVKYTPGAFNGIVVAGGDGIGSDEYRLSYPCDIYIGSNTSVIWIADTGNHRVVRWDSPLKSKVIGGSYGIGAHQFYWPYGIYVDTGASNTLYVADTFNHRVQMWLPGATNGSTVAGQTGVRGTELNQLYYPTSVTIDQDKNIFIVDSSNARIMHWTIGSSFGRILAGGSTTGLLPSQLSSPYRIHLDPNRAFIVSDHNNNRIQNFDILCRESVTVTTTQSTSTSSNFVSTNTTGTLSTTKLAISTSSTNATSTRKTTTTATNSFACTIAHPQWCTEPSKIYDFNENFNITVPGFYAGCFAIESLLQSTLECFYSQTCIDEIQRYITWSFSLNVTALNSTLPSIFLVTSTISDILSRIMIEEWYGTAMYDKYFQECTPTECRYVEVTKNPFIYVITTSIGVVGGLTIVLTFIVPRMVNFVRNKNNPTRQKISEVILTLLLILIIHLPYFVELRCCERIRHMFPKETTQPAIRVMTKKERALSLWFKLKIFVKNFNLFPSVPPSTAEQELQTQRISTRLFIVLFLLVITILLFYTSSIGITQTITVKDLSLPKYLQLYAAYNQSLICPCEHISINYGNFLDIQYSLHEVCSSVFVTSNWSLASARLAGGIFYSSDFRAGGYYSFKALNGLCQLVQNSIFNGLLQLKSTRYATVSLRPELLFQSETDSFTNEFRSSVTANFLISLNLIRNTTHGNRLHSILATNYSPRKQLGSNDVVMQGVTYYDCNCDLTAECIIEYVIYGSVNGRDTIIFNIPGFYSGCLLIESLLQSNLHFFYNQSSIDQLQGYLSSSQSTNELVPRALSPGRYSKTATMYELLSKLMIEEWHGTAMYDRYYNECGLKECRYVIVTKNSLIYVITTSIGVIGGLTTVLNFAIPPVVKLVMYCIRKWKARRIGT